MREIASNHQALFKTEIKVDIPEQWTPCLISELEAVPLALVLNELISNAVKHGNSKKNRGVNVCVNSEDCSVSAKIVITNFGQMPLVTMGTGLQLVTSLLPKTGAHLFWEQRGQNVTTHLELSAPILVLENITTDHNETTNL